MLDAASDRQKLYLWIFLIFTRIQTTMSQAPGSIENILKLMMNGKPAMIEKRLPIYLRQIQAYALTSVDEAEKVVQ